ncbi:AAA family ATPase [Exiguobacterium sp. s142]|uniref:AAA family ATPase n=1 Tax=Exiguobacterium sp. s142 TaxID=2751222 RepID=UPI001BEBA778|nr:AAA family ATPase [Exiguobacterium sp. s142]
MKQKVWIISGPAGVGKSTTAKQLARQMKKSAYISGDEVSHMAVSGREKPWESERANELVWKNIVALSDNFLAADYDVVVDWVAFWNDIQTYTSHWIEQGIEVRYVILWAEQDVHVQRDQHRPAGSQMGERVLILRNEFLNSGAPGPYYLDNTTEELTRTIELIQDSAQFLLKQNHRNGGIE